MSAGALARLLSPRSVAVVGASADRAKTTGRPVGYLLKHGFGGAIWPVNPRVAALDGLPCFPDIAALPGAPDAAIVLLGAERAVEAVRALAAKGCGAAIVLAGGFAEESGEGAARQAALRAAAGPMRLLGPNTIGLVNLREGIVLSASGALEAEGMRAGGISLVSQSGGILGAALSRGAARGLGFAHLVATGNEADLEVADWLDHLAGDEATRVIALYLEGVRNPQAFRAAARRAAEAGKPVVAFKVGRSAAGAAAAASHTGAMAGEDRLFDALFRQLGIRRAERFGELLDIAQGLADGRAMRGNRVAVLTSTGGAGALLADACGLAGLALPPPGEAAGARIAELTGLPPGGNPVDLTLAGLKPEVMQGAMRALLDGPDHDALAVVVGSSALAQPRLAAEAIAASRQGTDKPVLAYVSPHAPAILHALNAGGIPAVTEPEAVAAVLRALGPPLPPAPPLPPPEGFDLPPGPLDEAEAKALFARWGVAPVREAVARTPEEAAALAEAMGGTVVLKALSRAILHKTEAGGVRLGLQPAQVAGEAAAMLARIPQAEGLLVQEQVRGGVEMILGLRNDPHLGPAILLGTGGTLAELLDDVAIRLLPLRPGEAAAMLEGLRGRRLLEGWRGAPPADIPALLAAVEGFARLGAALGDRLVEAEVNPLFVMPAGQGVRAADGVAILR